MNLNDVKTSLELFRGVGGLTELRVLPERLSGYFEVVDQAVEALADMEEKYPDNQFYFILNELPAEFRRRPKFGKFGSGTTTTDKDIVRRNWLLIDADPVRPKYVSSTEAEKEKALEVIQDIDRRLQAGGFPAPVFADSGNGYHLIYRIDEPNDIETKNTIHDILIGLNKLYQGSGVDIDTKVANAARICKLYGTMARKGENTPERPHRPSQLLSVPDKIETTPHECLAELADFFRMQEWADQQAAGQGKYPRRAGAGKRKAVNFFRTLEELKAWLHAHNIGITYERQGMKPGSTILRVDCPNAAEHSDGKIDDGHITFFDTGWATWRCFHQHCDTISTEEFFLRVDPELKPGLPEGQEWQADLERDKKGNLKRSITNRELILLNDEKLSRVWFDSFKRRDMTDAPEFSNAVSGNVLNDESLEKIIKRFYTNYSIELPVDIVLRTLTGTRTKRARNPVEEFIRTERWDGVQRVETVLVRYLGAEDSALTRAVTRKWFTGAVARALTPGCQFDYVLTLPGPQGIGKTNFLRSIAGVYIDSSTEWFSNSFKFSDKGRGMEESTSSAWIIELGEMSGLKKIEAAEAKNFLTRTVDFYRPSYGKLTEAFPRHCVFAATTNEATPLTGSDGNRRWWVVPVRGTAPFPEWKEAINAEVPQLWAEALQMWEKGETLYLDLEMEMEMRRRQVLYNEAGEDDLRTAVEDFLDKPLPSDFYHRPAEQKRNYFRELDYFQTRDYYLRKYVCAQEILNEMPDDRLRFRDKGMIRRINGILDTLEDWERIDDDTRVMPGAPTKYSRHGRRVKRLYLRRGQPDDWDMFVRPSADDDL